MTAQNEYQLKLRDLALGEKVRGRGAWLAEQQMSGGWRHKIHAIP